MFATHSKSNQFTSKTKRRRKTGNKKKFHLIHNQNAFCIRNDIGYELIIWMEETEKKRECHFHDVTTSTAMNNRKKKRARFPFYIKIFIDQSKPKMNKKKK